MDKDGRPMNHDRIKNCVANLTLNPRASVFRHNGGFYLFDPATRTYASMNEPMLAFITNPDDTNLFDEISNNECKKIEDVVNHLYRIGILISPESADKIDMCSEFESHSLTTQLVLFVTTKCNLQCTYCYAHGGDSEKTISRDIWRLAMDYFFSPLNLGTAQKMAKVKNVNLTLHGGGEPTVEFAILKEIVADFQERANSEGLQSSISIGTNGTYNDSIYQWIIENNINVNISLDGTRDVQNRLRPYRSGQPSYDIVVHNLKGLVKTGRHVAFRATITDETVETMNETVELAKELGIATVHFEPVTLSGRRATTGLARPDAEQFAEKFLQCFLLGLKHDITVKWSGLRCFEHSNQQFCGACGQNFCVTPDGNITTCYEVLESNDPAAGIFFIGNVDLIHGRVVWDQSRIEKLKQRITENIYACKGCFLRYQCAGDCPIKSFRYSKRDLYSPDPYRCQISDRINKQLIAWLADGLIFPRDVEQASIISLNHHII
ncbi:MAG: radical SAM protein [Bacteroidetes bacterium]|nr:radical SAM protein [Bacteroidota bacterium]